MQQRADSLQRAWGRSEMRRKFQSGNPNGRDHLREKGADRRIILKLNIKK
jgi:hypothetical protein